MITGALPAATGGAVFASALVADITAAIDPVMSALYDGQSVQDVTDYAAMVATGNFNAISGRTIASAVVAITGGIAASDPLVEGQTVGFTVTVTDSAGFVKDFTAEPITVEYMYRVVVTAGNFHSIEVNELVPGAQEFEVVVTGTNGGVYDRTYTGLTANDLRSGIYNFADTVAIVHDGLEEGDVLSAQAGLWNSPIAPPALAYQWYRDGVAVGGATASTYTIGAIDLGADITLEVTGTDGTNAPVSVTSDAVSVPVGAPEIITTQIGSVLVNNTITGSNFTQSYNTGTAEAGKMLIVEFAYGRRNSIGGDGGLSITGNGSPPLSSFHYGPTRLQNIFVAVFDASAGGDIAVSAVPLSGQEWDTRAVRAHTVVGATSVTEAAKGKYEGPDLETSGGTLTLTCAVTNGSELFGGVRATVPSGTTTLTTTNASFDGLYGIDGGAKQSGFLRSSPNATGDLDISLSHNAGRIYIYSLIVEVA